ncbi:PREDICTED: dual specificity mitogen-activated protein kinase kinase hemipterous-like [Rhagoletis zephyria]|uniref:dual specificity mitogen-activated protein kinase kinase hemipterous-like n=1 Tax=Rhagoletis zephyria TaxID=28612 RepID=UPI0008115039|nr:PREDICTED: dual specificity mitogen-activated protein kinase kinase hemipterous-like [Rhagoletis zephyria]
MHDAPEYKHSSSSSSSREQQLQPGRVTTAATVAISTGARITLSTSLEPSAGPNRTTSTSSMESIGHKLHRLEKRLEEENNSHNHLMFVTDAPSGSVPRVGDREAHHMALPIGRTKRPNLGLVMPNTNRNGPQTEMHKKLKRIRQQSGILTINGQKYPSKMSDLEHLSDLGNGTSGNVVKMRHKPTGTILAVKQMRSTGNDEENNRILMDLDVILNSHDCPYIVHCLGYFVNIPDVWICMELMSMCFDKLLKRSKQPVPESILGKVTVATVYALSYLKMKHNVIHRDVKPSNILIDEQGNIKLCDFGISGRLVDSKANTRSAGCAAYMAPERIDPKKPKYDIRADVWSLGITLVELATGRSPYEGCNIDFEVLTKILDHEPPSLPYGDGCDFSQDFRNFVDKCLTKNVHHRPRYQELLQQPFFRCYDAADVNVVQWFKTVVESADIEMHRTHMPITTTTATLRGDVTAATNKHNKIATATIMPTTITTSTATINPKMPAAATNATHIPSYQNSYHSASTSAATQSRYTKKDDYLPQYHPQYPHVQTQASHHHQPSQLPQPIASYYNNSIANNHLQGERGGGGAGGGGVGLGGSVVSGIGGGGNGYGSGGSGNNSANSSSPQSPPSSSYKDAQLKDDTTHIVSEMSKLYRKSPFLQRKYSNGAGLKYAGGGAGVGSGAESPKKESMFSSIGQTIMRNLTTSPFSQKKHHTPQPHQVDPLWRMPNVHEMGGNAFDAFDSPATPKNLGISSPAMARKRFQTGAATPTLPLATVVEPIIKEQQPSLIPVNRTELNTQQRVQGNHSPIVLQRFYHQQNQLREKELEKRKEQQKQSTNPFLAGNYLTTAAATATSASGTTPHYTSSSSSTSNQHHYQLPQQQRYPQQQITHHHLPLTSAASSSHSTSSQSSTQSSSSQIAPGDLHGQQLRSPPNCAPPPAPYATAAAFGASPSQLQYQPLPQHYLPLNEKTVRSSRSPPTSPEQLSAEGGAGTGGGSSGGSMASKLSKLYARRQWQTTTAATLTTHTGAEVSGGCGGGVAGKEYRDEHGWFNTFTGAMKRQFASYVKLQLHSAASPQTSSSAASQHESIGYESGLPMSAQPVKPTLAYYRTLSAGSSSNTSNSTSPTDAQPKPSGLAVSTASSAANTGGSDFYDGTSGFLRRYAAAGASSMAGGPSNAHLLTGLDRRHRSPDPPPRYNRGQSPLLLRKQLLELSGQPPGGSPLLNRRFVNASPPLPPPRRGSESVPGSPQHFRTRIHYTPEPQRRIYRTIDQ